MNVIYNGTDITDDILVNRAEYDTFLGHHADKIMVAIDSSDDATEGWGFKAGDTIRIKEDALDSGKMTVYRVDYEDGDTVVHAAAIQNTHERKKNVWNKISFKELTKSLAKSLGCDVEYYGLDDEFVYDKVTQDNMDDLEFLNYRCWLEGCILIVYKGVIKIINEDWLEGQPVSTYRLEASDETMRTRDGNYLEKCTVYDKDRATTGTYSEDSGSGAMSMTFDFPFTSIDEARRFAKNILRNENRKKKTGVIYSNEVMTDILAGNLLTVSCGDWKDKPVAITHVRYDFENQQTKIWFRLIGG